MPAGNILISTGICRAALPDACQPGADHELHLVKDHERDEQVVIQVPENGHHHGCPDRKALLGAAEDDGYAVFP